MKKILVASDIHGSLPAAEQIVRRADAEGADALVLLGDLYYHGPRNPLPEGYAPAKVAALLSSEAERIVAVRGNCDSDVDLAVSAFPIAESAHVFLGARRFFAAHGDVWDKDRLPPLPKGSVLLFGHTHVSGVWERDGRFAANPGSASLPKEGTEKGYLLATEEGLVFRTLSGETYLEREF